MTQKPRILLVRDGAIGDTIMMTGLAHSWADKGYEVHVACKRKNGDAVFPFNPYVSGLHELPPQDGMGQRRDAINKIKDKIKPEVDLDLAFTCEGAFLFGVDRPEFKMPLAWRQMNAKGKSYQEHVCCTVGGGARYKSEMYSGSEEDNWWARFRANLLGWKIIQVQLTGSSPNKIYPYTFELIKGLQDRYPRSMIITSGDPKLGPILEQGCVDIGADPRRMWATCGDKKYGLRDSLITTKYVDLVIGPETGVLNAAACFDTPKIVLLSHSNATNLCKGWQNCYPIQGQAKCSPCYKLLSDINQCADYIDDDEDPAHCGSTRCLYNIKPEEILTMADIALRNGRNKIIC